MTPTEHARQVQPRACGEHGPDDPDIGVSIGSAPRVRGTQRGESFNPLSLRFSPARAGNTISSPTRCTAAAVQPRACGEHTYLARDLGGVFGSAPRVRGTLCNGPEAPELIRFSPARAGNTTRRWPTRKRRPVQPRACGEHERRRAEKFSVYGSAPRVRGTRTDPPPTSRAGRFSPARAGNT